MFMGPDSWGHYVVCVSMGDCGESGGDVGRVVLIPIVACYIWPPLISVLPGRRIRWTIVFWKVAGASSPALGAGSTGPGSGSCSVPADAGRYMCGP